jgi:hypothetical protein
MLISLGCVYNFGDVSVFTCCTSVAWFVCLVPVSTTWCVLRLRMEERPPDVESSYVDTKICFLAQHNTVNISISQLPASLQLTFNSEELTPLQGYSHVIGLWVCMYVCVCVYIYIYIYIYIYNSISYKNSLFYRNTGLLQPVTTTKSFTVTKSRPYDIRGFTQYTVEYSRKSHVASHTVCLRCWTVWRPVV